MKLYESLPRHQANTRGALDNLALAYHDKALAHMQLGESHASELALDQALQVDRALVRRYDADTSSRYGLANTLQAQHSLLQRLQRKDRMLAPLQESLSLFEELAREAMKTYLVTDFRQSNSGTHQTPKLFTVLKLRAALAGSTKEGTKHGLKDIRGVYPTTHFRRQVLLCDRPQCWTVLMEKLRRDLVVTVTQSSDQFSRRGPAAATWCGLHQAIVSVPRTAPRLVYVARTLD